MRQSHAGGEKLFLDCAGGTVPIVVDRRTGEPRGAHIFVAVMDDRACRLPSRHGPSGSPTGSQAVFFGGVPQLMVPDNAKVAVIKAYHFDRQVNHSCTDRLAITVRRSCRSRRASCETKPRSRPAPVSSSAGFWADCATESSTASPSSMQRLPRALPIAMTDERCASLARRAVSCSMKSMFRTSSRCR